MIQKEKSQLQREKEQLFTERATVKEAMKKSYHSMLGLAQEEEELVEVQVVKIAETIQQLQARITELDIQAVTSTPRKCTIRGRKLPRM
jgi:hypothetical protein